MPRRGLAGGDRRRPDDMMQRALRGHVVAVPQATPEEWRRAFPCAPHRLPDMTRVVLIGSASTDADVTRLAGRARALTVRRQLLVFCCGFPIVWRVFFSVPRRCSQVRGPAVSRWVGFLRGAYTRKFADRFRGFAVDEVALRAYQGLNGVPPIIAHNAVTAASEEEAAELQQVGDIGRRFVCRRCGSHSVGVFRNRRTRGCCVVGVCDGERRAHCGAAGHKRAAGGR